MPPSRSVPLSSPPIGSGRSSNTPAPPLGFAATGVAGGWIGGGTVAGLLGCGRSSKKPFGAGGAGGSCRAGCGRSSKNPFGAGRSGPVLFGAGRSEIPFGAGRSTISISCFCLTAGSGAGGVAARGFGAGRSSPLGAAFGFGAGRSVMPTPFGGVTRGANPGYAFGEGRSEIPLGPPAFGAGRSAGNPSASSGPFAFAFGAGRSTRSRPDFGADLLASIPASGPWRFGAGRSASSAGFAGAGIFGIAGAGMSGTFEVIALDTALAGNITRDLQLAHATNF